MRQVLFARSQRGATLIVALVILGIMTVLGVAVMQSSTLQERMAGNSRQKLIATNAAESALREAEEFLFANVTSRQNLIDLFIRQADVGSVSAEGLYTDRDLPQLIAAAARPLSIGDISDDDIWLAPAGDRAFRVYPELKGNNAHSPQVVIELMGQLTLSDSGEAGSPAVNLDDGADPDYNRRWVFRITAIGWSQNEDIYSVLRSTFITGRQFG